MAHEWPSRSMTAHLFLLTDVHLWLEALNHSLIVQPLDIPRGNCFLQLDIAHFQRLSGYSPYQSLRHSSKFSNRISDNLFHDFIISRIGYPVFNAKLEKMPHQEIFWIFWIQNFETPISTAIFTLLSSLLCRLFSYSFSSWNFSVI